jgi:hypothetical protein
LIDLNNSIGKKGYMPAYRILKIAIDYHDVVRNKAAWLSSLAKQLLNRDIPPEIFARRLAVSLGLLTPEQYKQLGDAMDCLLKSFPAHSVDPFPIYGSEFYIRELLKEGHFFSCVTASREPAFRRVMNFFDASGLREVKCITSLEYESKAVIAEKEKFDVFVDNKYYNLKPMLGIVAFPFLFSSYEYEHEYEKIDPRVIRVNLWETLYKYIQDIARS